MAELHPVGIAGLGLLGSAIGHALTLAGSAPVGWDPDPERMSKWLDCGMACAADEASLVRACGAVIWAALTTGQVMASIARVQTAIRPGLLVVDVTTGDPKGKRALARRLSAARAHYVDAAVCGSSREASSGTSLLLLSGADADVAYAERLLAPIARSCYRMGPIGAAASMKLVVNMALGLERAVLAETLTFGRSLGLAPDLVLGVLRDSPAASRVMDTKGARMVERRFDPEARLSQHLKDVECIIAAAKRAGAPVPLTRRHRALLAHVVALGLGDLDNSAIIEAYGRQSSRTASSE